MDKFFLRILLAGLIIVLSACGEDSLTTNGDGTTSSGGVTTGGSNGSSSNTTETINAIASLTTNGTAATEISESLPGTITVTVTDGTTGAAIVGALVTATTATLASFNPSSGTALTNSSSVATLGLIAGNSTGAGTVSIAISYNSISASLQFGYSIIQPTLRFGSGTTFTENVLALGVTALSAGGTTSVNARLIDDSNAAYIEPVAVTFTSSCVAASKASLDSPVTTINGVVNSTYLALGCVGSDVITATANVNGVSFAASATVNVTTADAGSIVFVGATPESITLQGTGGAGRSETSTVVFQVVDTSGLPVENTTVGFVLSTTLGGLSLSQASALSDSNGNVQTIVQAGTVSTSVRITASVTGTTPLLTSQSDQLVVTTGIPDQNSHSISLSSLNPNAWGYDGVKETVTVYMADHFNNPVPDDTAITFQTEGGQIEGSCLTFGGTCSVIWTSSLPRPSNGRVTILATAIGEEGFNDTNPSDGRYNSGETFTDLGEAYRDDNENGMYDINVEEYLDFGGLAGVRDSADSQYNGTLCLTGCTTSLLHVRAQQILVMSSDNVIVTLYDGYNSTTNKCAGSTISSIVLLDDSSFTSVCIQVTDTNNQVPPSGTTVSASIDIGEILGGNTTTPGDSIGNTTLLTGSIDLPLIIKGAPCTPPGCGGTFTVTVDFAANAVASTSTSSLTYVVQTSDVTLPIVNSFSPAAAIAIDNDAPISVVFSESMNASTITSTSFTVIEDPDGAGTTVTPLFSVYDSTANTLTFQPPTMTTGTVFEVRLLGTISDTAGNFLAPFTWRFVTK